MATSFVCLYRGESVGDARLIAVSADPAIVAHVSAELLHERHARDADQSDPVLSALGRGRKRALRLVHTEALAQP